MHVATAQQWFSAARPRTLPAAVAPVLVGTGAGIALGGFSWLRGGLALIVSLALQVGVNYANDYSDGIRGTDADRVGPDPAGRRPAWPRPPPSSWPRSPASAVAGVAGLVLAALTAWWLLPVGVACVAAAWFYTGGPRPYGYAGLGEVFVFVFFGLVAVLGTTYVQADEISLERVDRGDRHRPAGLRAAGGEQPARRAHRRHGRQAHAGRAARRAAEPAGVRPDDRRRASWRSPWSA